MKNNKGFTLIELLGIVVILVAIFLLAFPSLLGTTKQDEEKLYTSMVDDLCLAGETYIYSHIDDYPELSTPNSVIKINISTLIKDGNVSKDKVNPKTNKIINNHFLVFNVLTDNSFTCEYKDTICSMTKDIDENGLLDTGDEITCGTEHFYIVPNDTTAHPGSAKTGMISMLAAQNIEISTDKPKQSDSAGTIAFADGEHGYWVYLDDNDEFQWLDSGYVYDSNSNLDTYVEAYETYLKSIGVSSAETTLMSSGQSQNLSNNANNSSWLYSTNYWLGDEDGESWIWAIKSDGTINSIHISDSNTYGIRPVVILNENKIVL